MAYDPNYRPKPVKYPEVPTPEPTPDDVLIVSRKVYNTDGSVSAKNWFYTRERGLLGFEPDAHSITVGVKTDGRVRNTTYPLTELFWWAYEPASDNFHAACDRWAVANFGVNYSLYKSSEAKAYAIEHENRIKRQVQQEWMNNHPGEMPPSIEDMHLNVIDLNDLDNDND